MKAIIEGLLFLSGEDGMSLENLSSILDENKEDVKVCLKELFDDYESKERGIHIEFLGNNFKLTTKKEHKEYYKKLTTIEKNSPLSQSSLETLAIIAYNGPVTRANVDDIRGVSSIYVLRKLLLKGLIEDVGRADLPGKPKLYNVTSKFLDYFGLGNIDELPKFEKKNMEEEEITNLFESKYKEEI